MKVGDWRATLVNITRATTMDFFLFICGNYKIRSWGSSEEYIRQFQQLYTTVTGRYMDRNDAKEVYKVPKPTEPELPTMPINRSLVPPHGLNPPVPSPSTEYRRQASPQCRQSPGHLDI